MSDGVRVTGCRATIPDGIHGDVHGDMHGNMHGDMHGEFETLQIVLATPASAQWVAV